MLEDAAETFNKAGNAYKIANMHAEAGNAYLKQAETIRQTDSPNDAVQAFVEAANSFRKCDVEKSAKCYLSAIDIYNDTGRFSQSGRYYKELAELCEGDGNTSASMDFYQKAADIFNNDNKAQTANQCLLKIATMASQDAKDLPKAASIFESIGRQSLDSRLGAFSAKGYLFQALLCHLASGDNVASRLKVDEYKSVDYSFGSSRECDFAEKLLRAIDDMNAEDFAQVAPFTSPYIIALY